MFQTGNTPGEYKDFIFEGSSRVLENGSLIFQRVAKDGEGHYLCEARNGIGAGLSKLIFLKVNGKQQRFNNDIGTFLEAEVPFAKRKIRLRVVDNDTQGDNIAVTGVTFGYIQPSRTQMIARCYVQCPRYAENMAYVNCHTPNFMG